MKRIGLFIQGGHLLSNGITQQGHYTKLALENCGFDVDLLSAGVIDCYKQLGHDVKVIDINSDMSDYSLIIFVSALLTCNSEDNQTFCKNVKSVGCKFVNLICGNIFYLYQEELIFDVHNILQTNYNPYVDEVWVLPMYDYSIQMLETFFKRPVKIAPYIWNSDILTSFVKDNLPSYSQNTKNEKVTLFSAEPNMSVHKNAFVPLIITERYHHVYNKLSSLCVLCGNKLKLDKMKPYLDVLNIPGKVETYDRMMYFNVLTQAKEKGLQLPVIVSHQYLNDLNFVHFETLYLGWPLVHNCERLIRVGYYYDSHDVNTASTQIEYARMNHGRNHKHYMKNVNEFLDMYNPKNEIVKQKYINLVKNIVSA